MKKHLFFVLTICAITTAFTQNKKLPEIGIAENLKNDSLLSAAGYRYLVESISKLISPKSVTEEQFNQNVQHIKSLKTSLYAVNVFIPGELKLVGPEVDERAILHYAEEVFKRCNRVHVDLIVWGSGGARRVPDGFDQAKAKEQFISIAGKVAERAKQYNITLALENLNSTETNFITTLAEALEVVKKVNHSHFRLCADLYHMLKENEPASVIEQTKRYLVHCDIAEKENRTPPGTVGDDFKPYLMALKRIDYRGKIILECRWENLGKQAQPALRYLEKEIQAVYK
jgi:sugar phosphate isomerase/epimerase